MNSRRCLLFVAILLLNAQIFAGETKTAAEPAPSAPATAPAPIATMPDLFGGAIDKRPKATGNWGGARTKMAMKGIIWEIDLTNFLQHQLTGGADTQSALRKVGSEEDDTEFLGLGDIALIIDMNRTGLWKDGLFKFRAQGRFGDTQTYRSGSLAPTNIGGLGPVDDIDEEIFDITEASYTHFIVPNKFALFAGLLNTLDSDVTPFAGNTRGKSDFMHSDFNVNPVALGYAPYKTVGGGFVAMPHSRITMTGSIINRKEMSGHSPFKGDNYEGVTAATEIYVSHTLFNLPGGQMFGGALSWSDYTDLDTQPIAFVPPILRPPADRPIGAGEEDRTWGFCYNAWQYVQVFKGGAPGWTPLMPTARPKGWGVFFRTGVSDGNPNTTRWSISGGFGGDNPIRTQDKWGAGAFYRDLSDERLLNSLGVSNESGFEIFYNAEITPWFHITADAQFIEPAVPNAESGFILSLRTKIDF